MGRRATSPAKKRKRPWEEITPLQYKQGWDLVSTGHTIQQVLAATGLTKPQLAWLMKVGDESKDMPSYHQRVAEQAARIRSRAQDAADIVGAGAVQVVGNAVSIATTAQDFVKQSIAAHMLLRVKPALARIKAGQGTDEDLTQIAMPKGLRETLKMLRPYTDFSETARAFRAVFDSPHQQRNPLASLPKEVRLDLSGEAMLPATLAIIEDIDKGDVGYDPIDALMPEYKGWSAEDIEHYLATGERPAVDYGDDPLTVEALPAAPQEPAPEPKAEPEQPAQPTPEPPANDRVEDLGDDDLGEWLTVEEPT